ncbi:N-6 DNA methylase [Enterococcus casseliflavus]|nr:N-6 DNA methylase [Enterococcus casseliflavus]
MKGKNLSEGGQFMNKKKEIINKLQSITGKNSIGGVFNDWIHLMAYTLSNTLDHKHQKEREALYLQTIAKYTTVQAVTFSECLDLLVNAMESETIDWLGEIYMELSLANKSMGQCFTPNHVARLMAELSLPSIIAEIEEQGRIHYYEPCCGSGSMIIALASALKDKEYNSQTKLTIHCEDLDQTCLLMCYVQLSILGIKAKCQVKNTLTNEVFSTWQTPFSILFG